MIVYKIENTINKKTYIGQTNTSLSKRWSSHKTSAKNNYTSSCPKLSAAIRKYGPENFSLEILFESDNQVEIDAKEIELILEYNSIEYGYNLQLGGKLHKGHSQETRDKMSKTRKGKKPYEMTEAIRQRMSEALTGREYHNNLSDEGRKSISEKASARLKGKRLPDSAYTGYKTAKTYKVFTPQGEEQVIKNLREFSRENNLNYDCMIQIVRGRQKVHKGFKVKSI